MVKSGLNDHLGSNIKKNDIKVSPYRLAIHYGVAITLYTVFLYSGLFFITNPQIIKTNFLFLSTNSIVRRKLVLSLHLFLVALFSGNLMAGNGAGKVCNTFPKMGDLWYPTKEHLDKSFENEKYRNAFENQFLVHFNHRTLATATLVTVLCKDLKQLNLIPYTFSNDILII